MSSPRPHNASPYAQACLPRRVQSVIMSANPAFGLHKWNIATVDAAGRNGLTAVFALPAPHPHSQDVRNTNRQPCAHTSPPLDRSVPNNNLTRCARGGAKNRCARKQMCGKQMCGKTKRRNAERSALPVPPQGLEPWTRGLRVRCSSQLSYRGIG